MVLHVVWVGDCAFSFATHCIYGLLAGGYLSTREGKSQLLGLSPDNLNYSMMIEPELRSAEDQKERQPK